MVLWRYLTTATTSCTLSCRCAHTDRQTDRQTKRLLLPPPVHYVHVDGDKNWHLALISLGALLVSMLCVLWWLLSRSEYVEREIWCCCWAAGWRDRQLYKTCWWYSYSNTRGCHLTGSHLLAGYNQIFMLTFWPPKFPKFSVWIFFLCFRSVVI